MAKRKTKRHEPMPVRSSSQVKEDDSRLIFEKAIKPWMICSWIQRDFGIDAIVEITKPISTSKDQIVTGKRFSVQIKSSDTADFDKQKFSLSVPKEKINYWFNAIEPVLIVYIDLKSENCFYRWIDETLIRELFQLSPNWIAHDTVAIRFQQSVFISKKHLLQIEKDVLHWKRPTKTILTPGNYFKFSSEAKSFIDSFVSKVESYKIPFLSKEVKELKESTAHSIYTVAVVGPNKAGKSTLINCLLQREVSPVGMLPTTGIPITIFPNNENKTIVLFKDNTEKEGGIDEKFLREYTSKDKNPNNKKNVKLVSVQIVNSLLERGFAICDVPGLDDPDPEIRSITKTALYNANAIIYVISAGAMASHDFSINKQIIEDLSELGSKMDRLFLVFNKIDKLDDSLMTELKNYVNDTLEHFQVLKYLPTKPLYISAQTSFDNRVANKDTQDSVGVLEKEVWEYLLSQNKTGLHKILGSFADCLSLMEKFKKVIGARMVDSEKREGFESEIQQVSKEINQLRKLVATNREEIFTSLKEYSNNSFESILKYLENDLSDIPLNERLPSDQQIEVWLGNNAFQTLSDVYSMLQQDVYELQSEINQWISLKLKQVEIGIESPESSVELKMPEISKYTNQISKYFYTRKSGYLGVLESIFKGLYDLFSGILSGIKDAFTSDDKKREKHIRDIVNRARSTYNNMALDYYANLSKYLTDVCRFMEEKSIDRAKVYLGELSTQIKKLDQPISKSERLNFEKFLTEIPSIERGIESNLSHLKVYTDGVEWLK